jgi:molybdopterin-binding protein
VTVDIGGGNALVSSITRSSADRLKLKTGDAVTVVIKASEVLIAK